MTTQAQTEAIQIRCPICGAAAGKPHRSMDMRNPGADSPYIHMGKATARKQAADTFARLEANTQARNEWESW